MGTPITPKDCGHQIADYIYREALSNKELKSIAESINYKMGFFSPIATVKLRYELGCLYAFLGTLALRMCSEEYSNIHKDTIDKTEKMYVTKLLKWLPDSKYSEYEKRLKMWEPSFTNLDEDAFVNGVILLAETFYESLTGNPCNEIQKNMLVLRFNNYLRIFIGTFEQYVPDLTE